MGYGSRVSGAKEDQAIVHFFGGSELSAVCTYVCMQVGMYVWECGVPM